MSFTDLLSLLPPRQALAVAIGLSLIVFALGSNLGQIHGGRLARHLTERRAHTADLEVRRVAGEVLRWLYYLGLPYLTLLFGYNSVRALGVWSVDWTASLGWGVGLTFGSAAVLFWVWRPYSRAEHAQALDRSRWSWARHMLETFYQQAHWAFYRSGPILWLNSAYWGSFAGLALTLIEGWTNPNVRKNVRDTARSDAPLWTGSIAIVTTVIFIFTENTWYCLAAHLFLDLLLRPIIGFPRAETEEHSQALETGRPRYRAR